MEQQKFEHDSRNKNFNYLNIEGVEVQHNFLLANERFMLSSVGMEPAVFIIFGLKGTYSIVNSQSNQTYNAISGYQNFMYAYSNGLYILGKENCTEILTVKFPQSLFINIAGNGGELLIRFAENIKQGNNVLLNDRWGPIDLAIAQIIRELINSKHKGDLQKIFIISKCFELLVLCATSCCNARKKKDVYLKNPDDQEKIFAVKEIINEKVHCPPHLDEIAKMVGINVYKLKRGFKEVYEISVFKYLTEQRLNLAHEYLKSTSKTAAEIAYQLGYATPQHFSYMFKKKFGMTPHQVKNAA